METLQIIYQFLDSLASISLMSAIVFLIWNAIIWILGISKIIEKYLDLTIKTLFIVFMFSFMFSLIIWFSIKL